VFYFSFLIQNSKNVTFKFLFIYEPKPPKLQNQEITKISTHFHLTPSLEYSTHFHLITTKNCDQSTTKKKINKDFPNHPFLVTTLILIKP
jgi:hypothetical protein